MNDFTQRKLNHIRDLGVDGVLGGLDVDFAASLVREVMERVTSGRSADGDAYRALLVAADKVRSEAVLA